MPAWSAIFLDTCIFRGQPFDFRFPHLKALIDATKSQGIKLLLPHPTAQEIDRQLTTMVDTAVAALKSARRTNPVLRKLATFPQSREDWFDFNPRGSF